MEHRRNLTQPEVPAFRERTTLQAVWTNCGDGRLLPTYVLPSSSIDEFLFGYLRSRFAMLINVQNAPTAQLTLL